MKSGKAPGPDSIMTKFYKVFKLKLAQWLQKIMNNILENGDLPKAWEEATISMIPKDDKDSPKVRNFRPISLLNVDYKIFMKIISERLKKILNHHIGEDQVGFLPGATLMTI